MMINSSDITIKALNKCQADFDFMSEYFKVGKFETYMNDSCLYQIGVTHDSTQELIGLRWFKMKDNLIQLQYSVVKEEWRGKGINGLMLKNIDSIYGIKLITANVRESNIASLKSLQKAGYTINELATGFYANNEKKINLYKQL